jgi:hypothetical protein
MNLKSLTSKVGLLAAIFLLGTTAFAQQTKTVDFGVTSVKLSSTFTGALTSLGVTAGTVAPTRIIDGSATFPVTGGAIDLDTAAGNILHSGGLTLEAGGTEVRLQSFIIDTTGASPVITGLVVVNNKLVGRLTLFDLQLPAGFTLPLKPEGGVILQLRGVGVTLDAQAAAALNSVYSVTAFQGGLDIGTANVFAVVTTSK